MMNAPSSDATVTELNRALRLIASGQFAEAESAARGLLASQPALTDARLLLGISLFRLGNYLESVSTLRLIDGPDAGRSDVRYWLAMALHQVGQNDEAQTTLEALETSEPENPEIWNLLGSVRLARGQGAGAEQAFKVALKLRPGSAPIYANLGMAYRLQNKGAEAVRAFRKAVAFDPGHAGNYLQLFKQLQQLSLWDEARAALEDGLARHPQHAGLLQSLAALEAQLGHQDAAETAFRQLDLTQPDSALLFSGWLQNCGRFAESVALLKELINQHPHEGAAYRNLVEAGQTELEGRPLQAVISEILESEDLPDSARMHLHFALGTLYDRAQDFAAAAAALRTANSLAYRTYPRCQTFDPEWTMREPEVCAGLYTSSFFERVRSLGSEDDRLIFIVGMIRSGTTLLDRIVSAHPMVKSGGEGTFWNVEGDEIHGRWLQVGPEGDELKDLARRYLLSMRAGDDAARLTDKMPLNFRHLGPILAAFPKAKVLHIRRDPFDTCLSILSTYFAGGPNFTYHPSNIATFYRGYLRHMEHWRSVLSPEQFHELDYENLVADPEPVVRQVVEFLGLPWDPACLEHQSNSGQILTPSRWQARQPMYSTSVGKQANYNQLFPEFLDLGV